ncbi:4-hydroxy-tetrahydrodipicolinate synthase [Gilvimarinus sp. F26214L]|uniref:4-hydroxy-tetrahydrodipicolinate synthase n=1 Tax=Gilvimarinus sp. DZF01 TaxID=3461371 RepID=UPI00404569A7
MLQGSMVALVTPMNADNRIDWDCLARLVEWHIEKGTHAIVAAGTTGESATLSMAENKAVIKAVVETVRGRVPVIAGTGANNTLEALELTESAKESGADACLLVTPYYNKPTQEGLFRHYQYIAQRVAIPQLLYNVPGRTGVDMQPETALRLAQLDNIIGIKEATGDMVRAQRILDEAPAGFLVISGDDPTALDLMLRGGRGNISVTANVVPDRVAEVCSLALAGKAEEARSVDEQLQSLNKALFLESNPIPVKWALHDLGMIPEGIRLPLTPLAEQYRDRVREALRGVGL